MKSPIKYAKEMVAAGKFPMMVIEPGENGTFWLHDADFNMLDCMPFMSREKAELHRSKIIAKAGK